MVQYTLSCSNDCDATGLTRTWQAREWRFFHVRIQHDHRLPWGRVTLCGQCAQTLTGAEIYKLAIADSDHQLAEDVVREATNALRGSDDD